jgi:hypothetical protein
MWRAHGIRLPRFRTLMSRIEQRPRMMCVRARPMRTPNGTVGDWSARAAAMEARPIADAR